MAALSAQKLIVTSQKLSILALSAYVGSIQ